jgi:hypothetical protein
MRREVKPHNETTQARDYERTNGNHCEIHPRKLADGIRRPWYCGRGHRSVHLDSAWLSSARKPVRHIPASKIQLAFWRWWLCLRDSQFFPQNFIKTTISLAFSQIRRENQVQTNVYELQPSVCQLLPFYFPVV